MNAGLGWEGIGSGSNGAAVTVRLANPADIPFIMATERLPGYDRLVGRWEAEQHEQALSDPRYAVFVGMADRQAAGFAIVDGWAAPTRVTLIKRLAVAEPGSGHGSALLRIIVDKVFAQTDAYRLWIGCFPENMRARRVYEGVGFVAEGISRGSAYFHGVSRDELVLAMVRPEWEHRRAHGSSA